MDLPLAFACIGKEAGLGAKEELVKMPFLAFAFEDQVAVSRFSEDSADSELAEGSMSLGSYVLGYVQARWVQRLGVLCSAL